MPQNTTPAAVERFYFMSWGMAPSIGGTWVSHSDYAALSAQLEDAVATADDMEKEAHSAIALWGAALKDRDTARAEGKAEGLREAAKIVTYLKEVSGKTQDGDFYVGNEAASFAESVCDESVHEILALIPADTPAAGGRDE